MNKNRLTLIIVLCTFACSIYLLKQSNVFYLGIKWLVGGPFTHLHPALKTLLYHGTLLLPTLAAMLFLYGRQGARIATELGLNGRVRSSLGFALLTSAPMLIGYAATSPLNTELEGVGVLKGVILAAVLEEILFRGFLFGQLYRRLNWGFLPAALVSAGVFGVMHMYQTHDLPSTIGVVLVTLLGGMWFAWLYIEWEDTLWVPLFLHALMNLWWMLFSVSATALGGAVANLFRVGTIVLSIALTLLIRKKRGGMRINRARIW